MGVLKFTQGIYNYMCTRNNAFTNRSQKGTLVVADTTWANGAFPYWEHHEDLADYDWSELWADLDYSYWQNWEEDDWNRQSKTRNDIDGQMNRLLRLFKSVKFD